MNSATIKSVVRYTLPLLVILSLLLYLPLTPNFYSTAKMAVVVLGTITLLTCLGIASLTTKEIAVPRSRLHMPLALFVTAIILNLFVNKEGLVEGIVQRGALYIGGAILAYFATYLTGSQRARKWLIYSLIGTTGILAIHSLLQLTTLYRLDSLPTYMASRAFTPTGSPLTTLTILIIGATTAFYYASRSLKNTQQYLVFALATVETIAAVAYISLMLPGSELAPNLLPYQASWSVALDALKSPRNLLFGIGLANFPSLFTAVKPLFLNTTPQWNLMPASATSELLQLVATTGLTGLVTFLLLPITILLHKSKSAGDSTITLMCMLALAALILTPASIPVVVLFFVSLGMLAGSETRVVNLSPLTSIVVTAGLVILAATTAFYTFRVYAAENHMFRAQRALAQNDGKAVYEEHIAAIRLVPAMSPYRLSYSQVNLSLASALSQKQDLTEAEREQVTQLVQQAISEGKTAASLRKSDVKVWQNLGNLYRNLINVAEGAEQFSLTYYAQAITLDPANPALRVEYGGLLYQLAGTAKEEATKTTLLSRAIQEFQTAVQLKNNYANGYYNLSKALESVGNVQGAYAAMQKAIAGLDPNSPDVGKATAELESLKGKLPKPSPTPVPETPSELTQPSPLPSPIDGGPIEVEEPPLPSPTPAP